MDHLLQQDDNEDTVNKGQELVYLLNHVIECIGIEIREERRVSTLSQYWRSCADILRSIGYHDNNRVSPNTSIIITQSFIKSMVQSLSMDSVSCVATISDCLSSILSLNPIPSILYRLESMLPLVVAMVTSILTTPTSSNNLLIPLLDSLNHLMYVLSIQGNTKKVFTSVCQSLVGPLLSLRYQLLCNNNTTGTITDTTGTNTQCTIVTAIDKIFKTLFTRDHLPQYLSVVAQDHTPKDHTPSSKLCNYTWHLIKELKDMHNDVKTRGCVMMATPTLLKILIDQNKSESQLSSFQLFQVSMLFLNVLKGGSDDQPLSLVTVVTNVEEQMDMLIKGAWSIDMMDEYSMEVDGDHLSELLMDCIYTSIEVIARENVYQVSEAHDEEQLVSLYGIMLLATNHLQIHNKSLVDTWYGILSVLLSLNHRLFTSHVVSSLWSLVLVIHKSQQVSSPVMAFYSDLIKLYGRLHQLPDLIKAMLEAVSHLYHGKYLIKNDHNCTANEGQLYLPQNLKECLHLCLSSLPTGQYVSVLRLFTDHLKTDYLPLWAELPVIDSGRKKRRRSGSKKTTPTESDPLVIAINSIVDILDTMLRPLPVDVINNGRHSEELVGVVKDLINDVSIPLMQTANVKPVLQPSALYLFVTVAKMYYTMHVLYPDSVSEISGMSLEIVHDQENPRPVYWERVAEPRPPLITFLMVQLYSLYWRYGSPSNTSDSEGIQSLLQYESDEELGSWNGEVLAVSSSNQITASWCVYLESLPITLCNFTNHGLRPLEARFIIDWLTKTHSDDTSMRMSPVLSGLMCSLPFKEMKTLHCHLMTEGMSRGLGVWPKKYYKEVREMLDSCAKGNVPALIKINDDDAGSSGPGLDDQITEKRQKKLMKFMKLLPVLTEVFDSIPVYGSHGSHVTSLIINLSSLFIAAKVACSAITDSSPFLQFLSLILLSLSNVIHQSLSYYTSLKKKSWPSLETLLPWLLDAGILAVNQSDKKLELMVLVAMEKVLEYKFSKGLYPVIVIERLTELCESCDNREKEIFLRKCYLVVRKISEKCEDNTTSEAKKYMSSFDDLELNREIALIANRHERNKSGCGLSQWLILQLSLTTSLRDMPLGEYLTHKELFRCSVKNEPTSLSNHNFIKTLLTQCQNDGDDVLWGEFVGVISKLSQMGGIVEKLSQSEEEVGGVYQSLQASMDCSQADSHSECDQTRSRTGWVLCWLCVLESDLKHPGRMALTKHINKILVCTIQYLKEVNTSNAIATILGLMLLEELVMIPNKVGLSPRSVVLLLNVFSIFSEDDLTKSPQVLLSYQQLLLSLVFNHTPYLASCASTLLSPVIKCMKSVISLSQLGGACRHGNKLTQLTRGLARLIEALTQQTWFKKNCVYCVAQYLVSSAVAPIDRKTKGTLSSAVLLLLNLMSEGDRSYVMSSVDEQGKEHLSTMYEDWKKFYKFKGKV